VLACGLLAGPAWAQHFEAMEYYHYDALGSVRLVVSYPHDSMTYTISRHDYLPFGEEIQPGTFGRARNLGYGTGDTTPQRFTAKERDPESNLDYFGARYYSGAQGRFTSADPGHTVEENTMDPQRWNRYAYARSNPLKYVDPDGKDFVTYSAGVLTAFGSNLSGGIVAPPRGSDPDFQFGQIVGNGLSLVAAGWEASIGGGMVAGGGLATATVAGSELGVPAAVGGGALVLHSAAMGASATVHLSKSLDEFGGPKTGSEDSPGAGKRFSEKTKAAAREESPTCVFCEKPTTREPGPAQSNIDHAKAKSRNGNNTIENAQNTCRTCNLKKGTRSTKEYLEQQ